MISTIMSKNVHTLKTDNTLLDAINIMKDKNIGCIPIMENNNVVGIITDRDILLHLSRTKRLLDTLDMAMTSPVYSLKSTDSIIDLSDLMGYLQIRRVPIIDNNRLVGIVSITDLSRNKWQKLASDTLAEIAYDPTKIYNSSYYDYLNNGIRE